MAFTLCLHFIGFSKTKVSLSPPPHLTFTINYIMKCEIRIMFVLTNFCLFSSSKIKIYPFLLIFTIHALQKTMMSTRNRRTLSIERTISVVHRFTSVNCNLIDGPCAMCY